MQAIILAAGRGVRLKEMTDNITKCMVEINGESLISKLLNQIDDKGLSKIVVVTGYLSKSLENHINSLNIKTPVKYIENDKYYNTNNIYSLALAEDYLCKEDSFVFESDLILEDEIIESLFSCEKNNIALLDKYDESWMDGTCVLLDNDSNISELILKSNISKYSMDNLFKTVNIYKFSKDFCRNIYMPELNDYMDKNGMDNYYESVIKDIVHNNKKLLYGLCVADNKWHEIDTQEDLKKAKEKFQ